MAGCGDAAKGDVLQRAEAPTAGHRNRGTPVEAEASPMLNARLSHRAVKARCIAFSLLSQRRPFNSKVWSLRKTRSKNFPLTWKYLPRGTRQGPSIEGPTPTEPGSTFGPLNLTQRSSGFSGSPARLFEALRLTKNGQSLRSGELATPFGLALSFSK